MIGIVGPEDSVALALRVAAEMGVSDQVVPRAYHMPDEAPELARELDAVCQVILFSGRVPYSFARSAGEFSARLDFIPHSGIDLYRALVLLLRQYGGRLPTLSIDTIEPEVVAEVWRDLALEPPTAILPLTDDSSGAGVRDSRDIVAFHLAAWSAGSVELCLTCFRSVYDALVAQGVTAFRVEHTRASVRDALTRALQTSQRVLTEAQQIAVGLVEFQQSAQVGTDSEPGGESHDAPEQVLEHLRALLHARVQPAGPRTHVLFTTWGVLQRAIRQRRGTSGALLPREFAGQLNLGFGLGATIPRAEENARRALVLAQLERTPHVVFADGSVRRLDGQRQRGSIALRATDSRLLERARDLRINVVSLQRLVNALQHLDAQSLTAHDLADALGMAPRSARRILLRLQQRGIVHPYGRDTGPGAGRPRLVYRVDSEQLLLLTGGFPDSEQP